MADGIARTTGDWEVEVGRQLRELRLRANVTQADLARRANVGISSLRSLEHGDGSSLSTLVRVVRALGREDWLDQLAPPVAVSPMAKLADARRAEGRRRQRASSPTRSAGP